MGSASPTLKSVPLKIVGSNVFGRYPKINSEATFNMIISDGWLVPFAGHKIVAEISSSGKGRGIFNSNRLGMLIIVINNIVYSVTANLNVTKVALIDTFEGDVFIDENDAQQIAICDQKNIYIYDYGANIFAKAAIDFIPGYITFQDGYFISAQVGQPKWRLSAPNNGLSWPAAANNVGEFQTKPDNCVACIRIPGKGNQLFVMGNTLTESWADVGYQLFPYQRSSAFNIDYGCVNPSTIATGDSFICWLAINEKSGPVIMYSAGGEAQQVSNDGINFKLASINHPEMSYASLYKQDGHLFYHLTFYDALDNFTLIYDFNTKSFFYATDQYMNCHIAKKVVYFANKYYFISLVDGNLYELNSNYYTYDGEEIPKVRVCNSIRLEDSSPFIANSSTFTLEQGESSGIQRIDTNISRDGGVSFGNSYGQELNSLGIRKNRIIIWNLGFANDMVMQFRFWGQGRFLATNGVVNLYQ